MAGRKGKKHEHVNHERWLVSYADFITLLFAFFVVMFAVSQVDSNKLGRFAESVSVAFQEGGIFSSARGTPLMQGGGGGSSIVPQIVGSRPSFMQYRSPSVQAETLRDALVAVLEERGLSERIAVRYDPRGVVLSIAEEALFSAGSGGVAPTGRGALDALAEAVAQAPGAVQVQAWVDESPAPGRGQGPSPWELGALRTARVTQHLADESGLEPGRFSCACFAEPWPPFGPESSAPEPRVGRLELILVTEAPAGPP